MRSFLIIFLILLFSVDILAGLANVPIKNSREAIDKTADIINKETSLDSYEVMYAITDTLQLLYKVENAEIDKYLNWLKNESQIDLNSPFYNKTESASEGQASSVNLPCRIVNILIGYELSFSTKPNYKEIISLVDRVNHIFLKLNLDVNKSCDGNSTVVSKLEDYIQGLISGKYKNISQSDKQELIAKLNVLLENSRKNSYFLGNINEVKEASPLCKTSRNNIKKETIQDIASKPQANFYSCGTCEAKNFNASYDDLLVKYKKGIENSRIDMYQVNQFQEIQGKCGLFLDLIPTAKRVQTVPRTEPQKASAGVR